MSIGTSIRSMILVRDAQPEEAGAIKQWLEANIARNALDSDMLLYPGCSILAAHNKEQVITYTPIHPVIVIESVGVNPQASNLDIATAMIETVRAAAYSAYRSGARELHFLASDELTAKGAEKLGFEKINFPVYRLKLK